MSPELICKKCYEYGSERAELGGPCENVKPMNRPDGAPIPPCDGRYEEDA